MWKIRQWMIAFVLHGFFLIRLILFFAKLIRRSRWPLSLTDGYSSGLVSNIAFGITLFAYRLFSTYMSVCERDISRKLVRSQLIPCKQARWSPVFISSAAPSCLSSLFSEKSGQSTLVNKNRQCSLALSDDPAFTSIRDAGYRMHLPSVSACFILGPKKKAMP